MRRPDIRQSLVLAMLTLVGTARCGNGPRPQSPRSSATAQSTQSLRIRIPADLPRIPCLMENHVWCDRILVDTVYERLVRFDPESKRFVGVLAESWRHLEKGRRFQLKLRSGVRWHHGPELHARDVKHTLKRLIAGASGDARHPAAHMLKRYVTRIGYPTDDRIEIYFKEPFGPILELLASIPITPAPKTLAGEDERGSEDDEDAPPRVTGTGPYRFIQWWPGEKIVIARNPGYWSDSPAVGRVEFHVISAMSAALTRIREGKVDMLVDLTDSQYRAALGSLGDSVHPVAALPAAFAYLSFNTRRPPLDDVRVRRALARMVNREKLASVLAGPRPVLLHGPIWHLGPQRPAALGTAPEYDPSGAAALLREAGWRRSPGGPWKLKGKKLAVTLVTARRSTTFNRGLRALRVDLERAGVTLHIREVLWGELVLSLRRHDYDLIALMTPLSGPWSDLHHLLHSDSNIGSGNHAGYNSPAVDRLLGRMVREIRPTTRLAVERRIFRHLGRDVPLLPLHAPRLIGLSRKRIERARYTYSWIDLASLKVK